MIDLKAYCVYCKTGSEVAIAQRINEIHSDVVAYAPVRVLQERRKRNWEEREQVLIPSYVFIYFEDEVDLSFIRDLAEVYKILQYESGSRELTGSDYEYALWIYRNKGRIGISKTLTEGDTITVIDGPLLDGVGKIIKLDKHKRRAWVEFDFDGKIQKVSLSVQCLER